ncbi:tetratricopeptide repeat protein [Actinoplanes sp. NPDC023801]|uniref:tetratricopeptide repeat protein n=1 Tax=Actinoplanes sp. NPDC023801 TaxID=3154595 RepID=UPI0034079B15
MPKSPLTPALERARALIASGDLGPAQVLLERAVELGRENLGEDEPDVLTAQRELAGVFLLSDDPMAARRMLEDAYAAGQWKLGDSDPVMLHISHDLGVVAEELGNKHEARKAFGRVITNGPPVLGEGHQFIARARTYLGEDPSTTAVRPEAPPTPVEPVPTGHPSPITHPSSGVAAPPAPTGRAHPAPPAQPVHPAPPAQRVQAVPPARPGPPAQRIQPGPPVPAEPIQPAPSAPVELSQPAPPVDRVPPTTAGHPGQDAQRPVAEGGQGHGVAGSPDPRAAIDRPTDVLPIARQWDGDPRSSGAGDQNQSSGTGQPPAPPQPGPPAVPQRSGYSQAGQQSHAVPPGYGTAQAGHPAGHTPPQQGGPPGYAPGQAAYPQGYAGQAGYPVGWTDQAATPGYAQRQTGHASAPPAPPVGQSGHSGYPQPDGHVAAMPPAWPGTSHPGWQGGPNPGWQGTSDPGWQGASHAGQQGAASAGQHGPAGPGWAAGAPGAAVQTYPYPGDTGAQAHPYQQKGRGLAVGLTVAATLVALTAVGALVVVLFDREQPPATPQTTASTGPVLAGDPPSTVRLDDRGAVVELTWRDPTSGKVPFVVTMARQGQQLKPVSNVGLGKTEALVSGLNPKLEYCFAVVAVYGTDRFASSSQVCTQRS